MKLVLASACFLLPVFCYAGGGLPCKQYEYSQLKDSSKRELSDNYCAAVLRDKFNADSLREMQESAAELISKGVDSSVLQQNMADLSAARRTCLVAEDAAWGMIKKKFRVDPPACK